MKTFAIQKKLSAKHGRQRGRERGIQKDQKKKRNEFVVSFTFKIKIENKM